MPFVTLGKFGLDIVGAGILHDFIVETLDQFVKKRFVPPQETRFEYRRPDGHVGA